MIVLCGGKKKSAVSFYPVFSRDGTTATCIAFKDTKFEIF